MKKLAKTFLLSFVLIMSISSVAFAESHNHTYTTYHYPINTSRHKCTIKAHHNDCYIKEVVTQFEVVCNTCGYLKDSYTRTSRTHTH